MRLITELNDGIYEDNTSKVKFKIQISCSNPHVDYDKEIVKKSLNHR